jgi:hypothetical protein
MLKYINKHKNNCNFKEEVNMGYSRGYGALEEEKERQETRRKNAMSKLWRFYLDEDEEADFTVLNEAPLNFREHSVKNGNRFDNVTCSEDDTCEECNSGENAAFKSAWLVIDHREYQYTDKNGKKKTGQDQVKMFVFGTKVATQMKRKSDKVGLEGNTFTLVKTGSGQQVTYMLEDSDEEYEYSEEEITELLPEALREMYDGSEDSIFNIIEYQVNLGLPNAPSEDEEEEKPAKNKKRTKAKQSNPEDEEEEESKPNTRKNKFSKPKGVISVEDDEEEEESEPVKKTSRFGAKNKAKSSLFRKNR